MRNIIILILSVSFIGCFDTDKTKNLSFKDCSVSYNVYAGGKKKLNTPGHSIPNKWEYEAARRKLALCLCELYLKQPNPEVKAKIIEILESDEEYFPKTVKSDFPFDSILEQRYKIFEPTILID